MKVIMRPVEMVAWFANDGQIKPIRFRMKSDNDELVVVKVEQIIVTKEEKMAGNRMLIFECQSSIEGVLKRFELKYEVMSCRWFLYKI